MKNYERITRGQLLDARDEFRRLLSKRTHESDWQRFFSAFPYVLSASLPLALRPDYILPQGRPGKADPDFVFYPWDTDPIPFYGVIELKRPDSQIVTITRSNVAILTRDAQTAIEQSKAYVEILGANIRNASRSSLCLGNQAYIFVIMGLQEEISQKLGEKLYREQIESNLPRNLQLLPYDTVFEQFEAKIPPKLMFLIPKAATVEKKSVEDLLRDITEEERHYWDSIKCG